MKRWNGKALGIYLAFSFLVTFLVYGLFLGDAGLYLQSQTKTRIEALKESIHDLERENSALADRYLFLKENPNAAPQGDRASIVLRFSEKGEEAWGEKQKNRLTEFRAIYAFLCLFLTLIGAFLLRNRLRS